MTITKVGGIRLDLKQHRQKQNGALDEPGRHMRFPSAYFEGKA